MCCFHDPTGSPGWHSLLSKKQLLQVDLVWRVDCTWMMIIWLNIWKQSMVTSSFYRRTPDFCGHLIAMLHATHLSQTIITRLATVLCRGSWGTSCSWETEFGGQGKVLMLIRDDQSGGCNGLVVFFLVKSINRSPPLGWRVGTSGLVARTTGLVRRQFHQGHCLSDNVGCRLVRLVRLLWFLFPSEIIQSPEMVWVEPYCLKQIIRPFFFRRNKSGPKTYRSCRSSSFLGYLCP